MTVFYHAVQLPLFISSKMCTACKEEYPLESFTRDNRRKDGYSIYCKSCSRAKDKAKYDASPAHVRALQNAQKREQGIKPPRKQPIHGRRLVPPAQNGRQICTKCRIEKPLEDFYKDTRYLSGHKPACKKCILQSKIAHSQPDQCPAIKICTVCKVEKHIDEFYKQRTAKDGHNSRCKMCCDVISGRRAIGKLRARQGQVLPPGFKWCHGCKTVKSLEEFPLDPSKKDGYYPRCRTCRNRAMRRWHEKHPEYNSTEQVRAYDRKWKNAHPLQVREKTRRRAIRLSAARTGRVSYKRILERDGMWCYICEKDILPQHKIHFDHKVPLKPRPGEPQGTHSEDNIHPTHRCCNLRKGNQRFEDLTPFQRRGPADLLSHSA